MERTDKSPGKRKRRLEEGVGKSYMHRNSIISPTPDIGLWALAPRIKHVHHGRFETEKEEKKS